MGIAGSVYFNAV